MTFERWVLLITLVSAITSPIVTTLVNHTLQGRRDTRLAALGRRDEHRKEHFDAARNNRSLLLGRIGQLLSDSA